MYFWRAHLQNLKLAMRQPAKFAVSIATAILKLGVLLAIAVTASTLIGKLPAAIVAVFVIAVLLEQRIGEIERVQKLEIQDMKQQIIDLRDQLDQFEEKAWR